MREADSLCSYNIVAFDSCLSLFMYFCNLFCVIAILWRIKLTYLLTYLLTYFLAYLLTFLLTCLLTYLLTYLGWQIPRAKSLAIDEKAAVE